MATGVTPNGTAWTTYRTTLSGTGAGFTGWGIANAHAADTGITCVVYLHGAAGAYNQFETLSAWTDFRNAILDKGWMWVEGPTGGLDPWGNAASESALDIQFNHVNGLFNIGKVIVLGRSMGGLLGPRWYNRKRATDNRFVGLIVNSGVQDLRWAYDWDGGRWTSAINTAWGVSSKSQLEAILNANHTLNPLDNTATDWTGANVLQLWGDADTLVPPSANGIPMRALYADKPALDQLDVRSGGDHSATNGSYLQVTPMVNFISAVTGTTPDPPPSGNPYDGLFTYRIIRTFTYDSEGRRHVVSTRA